MVATYHLYEERVAARLATAGLVPVLVEAFVDADNSMSEKASGCARRGGMPRKRAGARAGRVHARQEDVLRVRPGHPTRRVGDVAARKGAHRRRGERCVND